MGGIEGRMNGRMDTNDVVEVLGDDTKGEWKSSSVADAFGPRGPTGYVSAPYSFIRLDHLFHSLLTPRRFVYSYYSLGCFYSVPPPLFHIAVRYLYQVDSYHVPQLLLSDFPNTSIS